MWNFDTVGRNSAILRRSEISVRNDRRDEPSPGNADRRNQSSRVPVFRIGVHSFVIQSDSFRKGFNKP